MKREKEIIEELAQISYKQQLLPEESNWQLAAED